MRAICTRFAAALWLLSGSFFKPVFASEEAVNIASNGPELASTALNADELGGSFNNPIEVHEVVITLEQASGEPNTPRHKEERERLLHTLRKDVGTWDTNHARHRLLEALHSYKRYYDLQKAEVDRFKKLYQHTSKLQKSILEKTVGYSKKFNRVEHHLAENQQLCDRIVQNALEFYDISEKELKEHIKASEAAGRKAQKKPVSQALKHYVRDWTEPGIKLRELPFKCVTSALDGLFPDRKDDASPPKVLLPGSGLGRLAFDVADLGDFEVTANEWSMFMNLAYRFIETHRGRNSEFIRPFVSGWSHHATEANQFRSLPFPDISVNSSSVVMMEGDFTTSFNHQIGHYDVVLTYFFIDTARNLMSYFETIKKILKPGGHWINLGPLLYGTGPWVQLSLEEVIQVTEAMGFKYLDTDESCGDLTLPGRTIRGMEATYGFDDLALTQNAYKGQFWVAQKR